MFISNEDMEKHHISRMSWSLKKFDNSSEYDHLFLVANPNILDSKEEMVMVQRKPQQELLLMSNEDCDTSPQKQRTKNEYICKKQTQHSSDYIDLNIPLFSSHKKDPTSILENLLSDLVLIERNNDIEECEADSGTQLAENESTFCDNNVQVLSQRKPLQNTLFSREESSYDQLDAPIFNITKFSASDRTKIIDTIDQIQGPIELSGYNNSLRNSSGIISKICPPIENQANHFRHQRSQDLTPSVNSLSNCQGSLLHPLSHSEQSSNSFKGELSAGFDFPVLIDALENLESSFQLVFPAEIPAWNPTMKLTSRVTNENQQTEDLTIRKVIQEASFTEEASKTLYFEVLSQHMVLEAKNCLMQRSILNENSTWNEIYDAFRCIKRSYESNK